MKKLSIVLMWLCVLTAVSYTATHVPKLQTVLTGLAQPVLVTNAKDGSRRLFVVQQRGIIKVVAPNSNTATNFMDISTKVSASGSERGLLGLTFHPLFRDNHYFFVNYTRASDGATIIARYTATNNNTLGDPNSERILMIISQPFSNHNGGMVEFGPDGNLYIGMGDGGSANDPGARAQNINETLGKMLRIRPDVSGNNANPPYTIPPDNPFAGATPGVDEIYAIGLRNPWRFSFDRGGTNQLWAADVGQGSIEEVDTVSLGGNYGWRVYEGNTCTNLDPGLCNPANYIAPQFQYSHTAGRCSVTGGYVYRGNNGSLPNGAYTYADFCTGEVWYWQNGVSTLLQDTTRNVSGFGEGEDGEIYVVGLGSTVSATGTVDKIVRQRAVADFNGDATTDIAVFRPSTGVWHILNSGSQSYIGAQWGLPTDIPVPEDYDGDEHKDIAVYRPSNTTWYIFKSATNTVSVRILGNVGAIPVPGDYNGDHVAELATFADDGSWIVTVDPNGSNSGGYSQRFFGTSGDKPVPGDFDGDGKNDIAVFRPSNGTWYSQRFDTPLSFTSVEWGTNGDIPVIGDYDGDLKSDIAVFRPSSGVWYVRRSSTGAFSATAWGMNGDIPVPGNYDADFITDVAIFRPSTGAWWILRSSNFSFFAAPFGMQGDVPLAALDFP